MMSPSSRLHREYSIGLSSFIQLVVTLYFVVMDLLEDLMKVMVSAPREKRYMDIFSYNFRKFRIPKVQTRTP